jgi:hypothetical protein
MKQPTVGRIVHFNLGGLKHAAIVAYVHNDTCVNLCVIDGNGCTMNRTSVEYGNGDNHWCWPEIVDENRVSHVSVNNL